MSHYADLREYLALLEATHDLLRIPVEVDTLDEMGAFIAKCDYEGMHKALLFEKPKSYDIPVLANTVGVGLGRMARTFGISDDHNIVGELAGKMAEIYRGGARPPKIVPRQEAPCKEAIFKGEEVDLSRMPILRLNPKDGEGGPSPEGRFIASLAISRPGPNNHNLSYHRFEVHDRRSGTVWIFRLTNDARACGEAWGVMEGEPFSKLDPPTARPFEMAYVLGVGPEFLLTGANPVIPYDFDDYAFVGGLRGEPVEIVKCETIDVYVPASAEMVVEGIFRPLKFGQQGKFASFNGFYDRPRRRPTFEVTAITMRRKPIYQHVHIGRSLNECTHMSAIFRSVKVYQDVKQVVPEVTDVFVDPAAGVGFTVHMAMKKTRIGQPKMAMLRAYTSLGGFAKHVFVYDDDIDIRDPHERDWAIAHRVIADRDVLIIPNVMGQTLDPLAQGQIGQPAKLGVYDGYLEVPYNTRSFMGVDATTPLHLEVDERVVIPEELKRRADQIWQQVHSKSAEESTASV